MPTWLRWILGISGGLIVLGVLFTILLVASLSGGFDNLLDIRRPSADDDRVVRAGEEATDELSGIAQRLVPTVVGPDAAPRGTSTGHECDEGQHNWKIDDDYDLRCTARHISAFTVLEGSLSAQVDAMHRALTQDGWSQPGLTAPPRLNVASLGTGSRQVASYERGEDRVVLVVVPRTGFEEYELRFRQLPDFTRDGSPDVAAAELPTTVAPGHLTLLVELQRVSFEE